MAVISAIPVHREQAPARVAYFDPDDPDMLADVLLNVAQAHRPEEDAARMQEAQAQFPARRLDFARRYEEIARAVVAGSYT
jgi:hypothetical protein